MTATAEPGRGLNLPLLREAAARHADDPGERVARDYGILGPPETYFIGRGGIIRA